MKFFIKNWFLLDNIEFSLLNGINKIILEINYDKKDKSIIKQTEYFECTDLEIITSGTYSIEQTLKRIRPTHILRICD